MTAVQLLSSAKYTLQLHLIPELNLFGAPTMMDG